jgi:DNA polymerase II small subunit/DNA polymerase delta subunit B
MEAKCQVLIDKEDLIKKLTKNRMKSPVQSFDIHDCAEFEGVMSIEEILQECDEDTEIEEFASKIKKRFTRMVEEIQKSPNKKKIPRRVKEQFPDRSDSLEIDEEPMGSIIDLEDAREKPL